MTLVSVVLSVNNITDKTWELSRPMSPILTRKAVRETPQLGSIHTQPCRTVGSGAPLQPFGIHSVEREDDKVTPRIKIEDFP